MESSVHHPSPPNTYSYVQEENLGTIRKFAENYLLFFCITNQIHALHQESMGWRNLSKTAEKSSSSPLAQQVFPPFCVPLFWLHVPESLLSIPVFW